MADDNTKLTRGELKQKEKGNPYTLQELKASHHNFMLDHKVKMLMDKLKT